MEESNQQLYRYFDKDGNLLYVGISISAILRMDQHKHQSPWFKLSSRVEIENFQSRNEVLQAEKEAIINENPIYNIKRPRQIDQQIRTPKTKFPKLKKGQTKKTKKKEYVTDADREILNSVNRGFNLFAIPSCNRTQAQNEEILRIEKTTGINMSEYYDLIMKLENNGETNG